MSEINFTNLPDLPYLSILENLDIDDRTRLREASRFTVHRDRYYLRYREQTKRRALAHLFRADAGNNIQTDANGNALPKNPFEVFRTVANELFVASTEPTLTAQESDLINLVVWYGINHPAYPHKFTIVAEGLSAYIAHANLFTRACALISTENQMIEKVQEDGFPYKPAFFHSHRLWRRAKEIYLKIVYYLVKYGVPQEVGRVIFNEVSSESDHAIDLVLARVNAQYKIPIATWEATFNSLFPN